VDLPLSQFLMGINERDELGSSRVRVKSRFAAIYVRVLSVQASSIPSHMGSRASFCKVDDCVCLVFHICGDPFIENTSRIVLMRLFIIPMLLLSLYNANTRLYLCCSKPYYTWLYLDPLYKIML
jgi:hypothetical protein